MFLSMFNRLLAARPCHHRQAYSLLQAVIRRPLFTEPALIEAVGLQMWSGV